MKRVFKFVLVALAAAAVTVACQKPAENQTPDKPGPDEKPVEDVVPVEGTSDWSVVGTVLGSNWDKDYVMAASGDNFVLKNLKLAAATEFKIRFQKKWEVDRGGDYAELGKGFAVNQGGHNIKPELDGVYDIWYNPAVEQMAVVAKDGTPTWGEKQPEPDNFDYTPGAEYLAEDNLWKGTDEQGANFYIINNINDKGVESAEPESQGVYKFTHKQSTYAMHYDLASSDDWQRIIFLYPNDNAPVAIQEGSRYSGKISFYASKDIPRAFLKVVNCQTDKANREGGNRLFEVNPIPGVKAGEPTVIEFKDIEAGFNADNITLVIDFGGAPEDVNIYIKDIIIKKAGDAPVVDPDPIPGFDFTPSAEYLAETNLWKPAQETAIICKNDNPGAASSYKDVTVEQSTFMFALRAATPGDWANVWFVYPDENHPVALSREKQYKVKATFASNLENPRVFFKLCASQPDKANHEGVCIYEEIKTLPAGELVTFESEPFYGKPKWEDQDQGQTIDDIAFTLDFGGNQANSLIYLKDIIVEEVGGEVPPVVDAPESDVITVDILPTAYPSEETVVKNGDIEYNILLVANYGNGIQMKKQDSYISNKTAFKNIKTIKVTTATSKTLYPENLKLCAGTSENPTTEIPMKSGDSETAVWELDGEYTYFKLQNVSGYAVYLSKIEINPASDPVASTPTDLSSLKANCYVISEAGSYKIPAVKGNSNESVGTVASAAIIWETYNSGAAVTANSVIAKVGVNDGFIVFETPATLTPGNALIAALDASENILWSWHIWIPKNAITSSQFGLGGQTLMDRNLGALEVAVAGAITPESQGMLYSWGRKDPFLGNAVIGEKASYAVAEGQASVTIGASGVLMTVAESIKNPTTFVQTGSDDNKDWCSESDVAATLWGETKTMYDPCPAGYQVPYNPWDDAKNGIWNLKADDAILTTLGFSKNADQHWFQMGDPATVFPICGYLDQDGYKNRGARAYYWSARSTGTGIANVIRVDSSNNKVTDERKSRAGNIRCVVSE